MQMAIPESKSGRRRVSRGPWLPVWSLALGVLIFIATAIGGDLGWGFVSLGLFLAFAALFYFGARNEMIGGLAAPGRDERWRMINQRGGSLAAIPLLARRLTLCSA